MKRIKINHLQKPQNGSVYTDMLCYTVNLGNGMKKKFTNKQDATKFLNEVSKFLTYKMHECNELYISAFTLYRRSWFYFDHDKALIGNFAELYAKERLAEAELHTIKETFIILYKRANWANGNHYVFYHFNTITNSLLTIIGVLEFIYQNKSTASINFELEILKSKIIYCQRTINLYTLEIENKFKESDVTYIAPLKFA